jgi:pimeloyl-ACP methyl ester carboxylesterase
MAILEAADHPDIFINHAFPEQTADLGEIRMNYATVGDAGRPALVLVPGQSASWWSYQDAMPLLAEQFRVYAVDLRGQGRSTWTPGWLGDQWTIGDWAGMQAAMPTETPPWLPAALASMAVKKPGAPPQDFSVPPQNMREYDPEWGRAFYSGTATMSCDHGHMLTSARAPMLYTHHYRAADPASGALMGAASDEQVARARELVTAAGQPFEVVSLPDMAHAMHEQDPQLFASLLTEWAQKLEPR